MSLAALFVVPGRWRLSLTGLPGVFINAQIGPVVVVLGAVFWIALVMAMLALARRVRRQGGVGAVTPALFAAAGTGRARVRRRHMREIWGWLWRIEAAHLVLFVAPTLAVAGARVLLLVVTLPLWLVGSSRCGPEVPIEPLDRAACRTFVSWCPSPMAHYRHVDEHAPTSGGTQDRCAHVRVALPDPAQPIFKAAWVLLALGWIVVWQRRRAP